MGLCLYEGSAVVDQNGNFTTSLLYPFFSFFNLNQVIYCSFSLTPITRAINKSLAETVLEPRGMSRSFPACSVC
jgi:hypothetical protein